MAYNNDPLYKLSIGEFQTLLTLHNSSALEEVVEKKFKELNFDTKTNNDTLDIDGAVKLLKIGKQTIYQNIKSIPHRKIFGRLVFLKDELLNFIDNNGKVKSRGDPE